MVRSTVISPTKANTLFWLGRYEERVYLTLHQLRKCYDKMIDGAPEDYQTFWSKLDAMGMYQTNDEFTLGMMYDKTYPCSVIAAQTKAMDNAILLREDIMSESLSYIEMSVALMNECKEKSEKNVICLQPIIDWSLAFWGAAEQYLQNHNALNIMMTGRNIENLDMQVRFGYSYERVQLAFDSLKRYRQQKHDFFDTEVVGELESMLKKELFDINNIAYKNRLLTSINKLAKV